MRRASNSFVCFCLALGCALFGCRSTLPENARTEPIPAAGSLGLLPAGAVVAVRRPTPGVALLSLWIDAGSRDATPPQLATISAWTVAERSGVEARVLPDGTELRLVCDTRREGGAARCAKRLVGAWEAGAPAEHQLVALRERLRSARVHAASDDVRLAQSLSLQALFGNDAEGLFPLGRAEQDAQVTSEAVRLFIAKHYAPSRSLLVGLGDVDKGELERVARGSNRNASVGVRAQRGAAKVSEGLRVELGASNQLSLAVPVSNPTRATEILSAFRLTHPHAVGAVTSIRGAVLLHLTLAGGDTPFARLQSAVFDLLRLDIEHSKGPPSPTPDSLAEMARLLGETWVARGPVEAGLRGLAVGVVLRRDERATNGEDAALAAARERAQQAIAEAKANSAGAVSGEIDATVARVKSVRGARIEVVRRAGDPWFAAAVRMAGGSALDPPLAHGRAALLASLMADGCGFSSERALDVFLARMGAHLTPLVDADGFGVAIRAPMAHAEEALDALLRCAVRPSFASRAVEDARARLLQALWNSQELGLQASLARALSPAAPGRVAPWGTPSGVANVEASELKRMHAQRSAAPNVSVWAVADREPKAVAQLIARRVAHLPPSAEESPQVPLATAAEVDGAFVSDGGLRVVLGVATKANATSTVASQVFADALLRALAKRLGNGVWSRGGGSLHGAWAGVALALTEDQLDGLAAHTQEALRELQTRPDAQYSAEIERLTTEKSVGLSSAREWVESRFLGQRDAEMKMSFELGLIRSLAAEKPSYFVLRPRP